MEKQASVLGVMNGIITIAMAGAPVIGSFVTKYYGWRGNFMALLILCLVGIIMTLAFIPHDKIKSKEKASLSLKGYLPLLKSGRFMNILMAVTILTTTFWTFIGISPILYMKNLNVSIDHFGFYQGTICAFFAIVSLASPKIMSYFTHHTCLRMGGWNALFMACVIFLVGLFVKDNPIIITTVILLFCVSEVFPINILYPISLTVVEGAKARASGLYNVARLCFSAIGVETVGYFYTGTFFPMALFVLISASIAFILLTRTQEWKEIRFDKNGGAGAQLH
jgi:DHA1 family bicyclomycin/chloramphenicol resistance-like MFS transporter